MKVANDSMYYHNYLARSYLMKVASDYVLSQLSSEKLSDESCKRLCIITII